MKKGEAFTGFSEASINFPPTFKYNVMKSVKRDKSLYSKELGRALGSKRWLAQRSNQNLTEVQETGDEHAQQAAEDERGASMDADEDNRSIVSTAVSATSTQSRVAGNGAASDNDGYFAPSTSPRPSTRTDDSNPPASNNITAGKILIAKAALKAKAKWISIVRPNVPRRPIARSVSKRSQQSASSASFPQLRSRRANSDGASAFRGAASAIELGRSHRELRRMSSKRSSKSAKSSKKPASAKGTEGTVQDSDPGVYDTSSKQRVPSW